MSIYINTSDRVSSSHHHIDLPADLLEGRLVRYCHAFEDMENLARPAGRGYRPTRADDVDVCEATCGSTSSSIVVMLQYRSNARVRIRERDRDSCNAERKNPVHQFRRRQRREKDSTHPR